MSFSNAQNIRFWAQGSFKTKEASFDQILISIVWTALPEVLRKWFQLCHSKFYQKLKNAIFKLSEHSFLSSR